MIRVYSSPLLALAHIARDLLAQEGIRAEVRNEGRAALAGGLPVHECFVEVWVPDAEAEGAASALERLLPDAGRGALSFSGSADEGWLSLPGTPAEETSEWTCGCGEASPLNFERCWACGRFL